MSVSTREAAKLFFLTLCLLSAYIPLDILFRIISKWPHKIKFVSMMSPNNLVLLFCRISSSNPVRLDWIRVG